MSNSKHCYVELSPNPLRFEAVSKARLNNVFYDDSNNQLFTVQAGEVTEVVVKSVIDHSSRTFRVEEKGPVISIKFSPNQRILAVQRTRTSVEFINFIDGNQSAEYSQSCKLKKAQLIGFIWVHNNEILFITDVGVELYRVEEEKCSILLLKTIQLSVNWSIYCPHTSILLLSSGTLGNSVQVLQLEPGNMIKLKRIEIELNSIPKPAKLCLQERDITVCQVYDKPRVLVLRHPLPASTTNSTTSSGSSTSSSINSSGSTVVNTATTSGNSANLVNVAGTTQTTLFIYTIFSAVSIKKTHVLKLDQSGRFAVNIYDNLILVHHQTSKSTVAFDIGLEAEYDGSVWHHKPVAKPATITSTMTDCELYSPNWVMFQPNIIIDAKVGSLWHLKINLEPFIELISDKCWLINFLMLRSDSKYTIIKVIHSTLDDINMKGNSVELIGQMFDKVNAVYRRALEIRMISQMGSPVYNQDNTPQTLIATFTETTPDNYVDQFDMYIHIFSKMVVLTENQNNTQREMVWVLMEYFRSLSDFQIPIDNSLQVLIINSLVQHKAYYQLHQLLQYHVVSDSKHLACLLLSLENLYPAAHQLAIDMLQRLPDASEEIIEVLLSKQQILPALRFLSHMGLEKNSRDLSARKFLELAHTAKNDSLFYSVLNYFESKKIE
ncbi:regulator of MON1-CCZ1 complex protein bulli [Lycorma delicatula]|uniref:regulator of MON1-CCZ1 complex protein bulli n=1 Tax=Lycorma delicatula TaxID=130591 RepID=UPI003F511868